MLLVGCASPTPCSSSGRLIVDCTELDGDWRVEWVEGQQPLCSATPPRPETWSITQSPFGEVVLRFADAVLSGTQYEDHSVLLSGTSPSLGPLSLTARLSTPAFADAGFVGAVATGTLRVKSPERCALEDAFRAERVGP